MNISFELDGIPYYSMDVIDVYGYPETWGVTEYGVIEGNRYEVAWEPERKLKVHYYDRLDRFRTTLFHLLGINGRVDWRVVLEVHDYGWEEDPRRVWDSVRKALKNTGYASHYNRIPSILRLMGYGLKIVWDDACVLQCLEDFKRMSWHFDTLNDGHYFPNLRFTALMLMDLNGVRSVATNLLAGCV